MEKEYDLYVEYKEIYLKGSLNDKTEFEIYIGETDRRVTAKIPNNIKPYDKIRLSGLGKKKSNGKCGDLYISFKKVFLDCENEEYYNVKKVKKYEYKYVQETYCSVEETIQEFAEEGWRCVSVQPIVIRLDPLKTCDDLLEYVPDYEYNILLEKEVID